MPSNSGVWSVLMGPIGFSTGALAYSDFRKGLDILSKSSARAVELSALRNGELIPLLDSIDSLNLSQFSYVSFHAPGQFETAQEPGIIEQLKRLLPRRWPVIVHPDAIRDFCAWVVFRDLLCVENMDKRKVGGRTAKELREVFHRLPEASLCFDLGHVHQVDPTMTEAFLILQEFGGRLRQLHVSEVDTESHHDRLSLGGIHAFQEVAELIPPEVPVILESPASESSVAAEMDLATEALGGHRSRALMEEDMSRFLELGKARAALVLAMSFLEASFRERVGRIATKRSEGSTIRTLVEVALARKLIRPAEGEHLLEWMRIRNGVVHLGETISEESANAIVQGVRRIVQGMPTH